MDARGRDRAPLRAADVADVAEVGDGSRGRSGRGASAAGGDHVGDRAVSSDDPMSPPSMIG